MKRYVLTLVMIFVAVPNALFARDVVLSAGDPTQVGMDETILKSAVHMYETAVAKDQIPGVVLLVARDGKVVLHEAVGWKDKENRIPIQKDTMFRMASNTKPVVAAGISILVEEGKLNYNDFVRKHIQAFDNYRSGDIKIHHLLTHTSGFRIQEIFIKPLIQKSSQYPNAPNLQIEVDRFGQIGVEEPPGTTYSYNNPGYNTLGALIEIASGKPLEVFLTDRIYKPLGMVDSYHQEVADKLDGKLNRMSVVYREKKGGGWTINWKPGDPPQYPFVRASGGMISTVMDYAIFCQMFLNGGIYNGKRILKEETVRLMTSALTASIYTPEERIQRDNYYGYGWNVDRDGIFSHGGADGTKAWVDPAGNLIVLVFTQCPGKRNGSLNTRFLKLVQTSIDELESN
ncbi:MAG: beta-lactamase family protein [Sedimentisphaerales bacterium]|nr:beta-lactamase family protein [Sedimentisphaerales bacterium]